MLPYDSLAQIYDHWISTGGPELDRIRQFYSALYVNTPGPVVECGVGNGRILIEAALAGKKVIGIDSSQSMLDLCRNKAEEAGVAASIELVQADFRDFRLLEPAALIAVPYDSIGHLITAQDRAAFARNAYSQLAAGGRLVFDQAIHDVEIAARHDGQPRLRTSFFDERTGREKMLWYTSHQDVEQRRRRAVVYLTDAAGEGEMQIVGTVENSWVRDAGEMTDMLASCGFSVQPVMGDFDGGPLTAQSEYRVWIAIRR